jgi:hypothetical protein
MSLSSSSLSLSHILLTEVCITLILQSIDQLDPLQVEHFQQGETNRANAWDKFLIWSHTGLPGSLLPLKQLMNFFPATPLTSSKSFSLHFYYSWIGSCQWPMD